MASLAPSPGKIRANSSPPNRAAKRGLAGAADHAGHVTDHLVAGLVAPGVVEALEVVDVDHRQGERPPARLGCGADLLERLVESLAVRQVGERIGHGVAADRLEVLAQAAHLGGGVGELGLQRLVLLLDPPGGGGQGLDHRLDGLGVVGVERL
jgi:hypothetical protein